MKRAFSFNSRRECEWHLKSFEESKHVARGKSSGGGVSKRGTKRAHRKRSMAMKE